VNSRFSIEATPLQGLMVVERLPVRDDRGFLERVFCTDELGVLLGNRSVMQVNHTLTANTGTIRGMHFQTPPSAEIKMVSCLRGRVFDVAVDLRSQSPTYLQWFGVELSEQNFKSLWIPEGFAHGFQVLDEGTELLYLHTARYDKANEGGINPLDPKIGIKWPLATGILSERDRSFAMIDDEYSGIKV
jgi:dTDP-4-dehydrorhamnose 3,5-epimerase